MRKPSKPRKQSERKSEGPQAELVTLHREYNERRLTGGAAPTPQAYARAMAQWQRLPGAIPHLPAADLTQAQQAPTTFDEVNAPTPPSDTQSKQQNKE
jgi:hypothetical protein